MEYPTYYRQTKPTPKPLLNTCGKLVLLAYFGLTCFALGQFIEFNDTGVLFYVDGLGGYYWESK